MLKLASQSPRRATLLECLGVEFDVINVAVDESSFDAERPRAYVARVAKLKAAAGYAAVGGNCAVLAADTVVSCDDQLFGKPRNFDHARAMLGQLAGRWHEVHTAVTVLDDAGQQHGVVVSTRVEFEAFGDEVIRAYWESGEPRDKAGAYAIQGLGGALVRRIEGSYSAVVGLPLAETVVLLNAVGVAHKLSA